MTIKIRKVSRDQSNKANYNFDKIPLVKEEWHSIMHPDFTNMNISALQLPFQHISEPCSRCLELYSLVVPLTKLKILVLGIKHIKCDLITYRNPFNWKKMLITKYTCSNLCQTREIYQCEIDNCQQKIRRATVSDKFDYGSPNNMDDQDKHTKYTVERLTSKHRIHMQILITTKFPLNLRI